MYAQAQIPDKKPDKDNSYKAFPELEQIDIRSEDRRLFGPISKLSLIVSSDKYLNLGISMIIYGNRIGFGVLTGFVDFKENAAYAKFDEFNNEHPLNWEKGEIRYRTFPISIILTKKVKRSIDLFCGLGGAIQKKSLKYYYYDEIFIRDDFVQTESKFGAYLSAGTLFNYKNLGFSVAFNSFNFKVQHITLGVGWLVHGSNLTEDIEPIN